MLFSFEELFCLLPEVFPEREELLVDAPELFPVFVFQCGGQ
jgi:hypothetical protein